MAFFPACERSLVFSTFIVFLLLSYCQLSRVGAFPADKSAYDFIVVGGGAGGLAVASRIAQGLPHSSVLVLEAGADAPDESKINIPGLKGSTIGTVYDWNLTTVSQPHAGGRNLSQARGKVLGGSTALNLMTWDRASQHEYNVWETLGNYGWNWNTMITAMKKVETFFKTPDYDHEGIGNNGPVASIVNEYIPAQQNTWLPTLNKLGIKTNLNSLGGNPIGVMNQPSNIRQSDYKRSYAAHNPGYPSVAGSNLTIFTSTRVRKINFSKRSNKLIATGVTLNNGTVLSARNEVILAAGSFHSPQLLELSGIGSRSILSGAGIPILYELPGVGENYQDHIRIQASFQLQPNYTSFDIIRYNTTYADQHMSLYNANQKSIYDYTGSGYAFVTWEQALGNEGALKLKTAAQAALKNRLTTSPFETARNKIFNDYLSQDKNIPDLEIIYSDGYTGVEGYPKPNSPGYGAGFFTLIASIQHPLSMGSVHISSPEITTQPTINPNYLSQPYDVLSLISALQYLRKIANTEPMRSTWISEYEPGLSVIGNGDGTGNETETEIAEQYEAFVRSNALTIYHPLGTCAMLPESKGGVVDRDARVYGTVNLRVVDASVIPVLPSAHIQTAVYGIAEVVAEKVVGAWK